MNINRPEIKLRQKGRRSSLTFQSSRGTTTQLRKDIDILLSLKDSTYKNVMVGFFQRLGGKRNNENNEDEKTAAREALQLFTNRKRGERTRFFKPESRYSSKTYIEVDEAAALEKITADIYRRMESAKRWMNPDNTEDDSTKMSPPPPQAPRESSHPHEYETGKRTTPSRAAAIPSARQSFNTSTKPLPKSAKKNTKRKLLKKVPQSLPFLSNTAVADIIVEEELRAKRKVGSSKTQTRNDQIWQPEEVINFFRGLYVHGWGNTEKVSKMIKTRSNQHVKSYAMKLEKKFPELRKFFSSKQGHKVQEKRGVKVKRHGSVSAKQPMYAPQNDPMMGASLMGTMKHPAARKLTKPKVVICLSDHIIDTESEPSLIQPSNNRKRPADTLPDYFDPSVRPSVPTNSQHIYIPGNRVYARWLNKDDPGSYGTWYPGYINASKIAPIQDEYNYRGIPNLLYHVKFDDGAESLDLDTEDIMMQDQYQVWLKDLEQYYSLPVAEEMTWKRLTKNTRVYAKWIDPTDPELHGSWMSGQVHSSRTWEDEANQWRHSYHIYFDNGDQDEDLLDGDIVEEELYTELLSEKMEKGRKKSRLSGFDLITEASKISSPIKTGPSRHNDASIGGGSAKKNLYPNGSDASDEDDSLVEELRCNEVLELRPPSPTHVARLSSTPSPDVHYGMYIKTKPWAPPKDSSVPQDQAKPYAYSTSTDAMNLIDEGRTGPSNVTNLQVSPSSNVISTVAVNKTEMRDPDEDTKEPLFPFVESHPAVDLNNIVESLLPSVQDCNTSTQSEKKTTNQSSTVKTTSFAPVVQKVTATSQPGTHAPADTTGIA
ncbi:hypothetical protein ACHAXR_011562 [Thalassiosira sp. AJA248-18]